MCAAETNVLISEVPRALSHNQILLKDSKKSKNQRHVSHCRDSPPHRVTRRVIVSVRMGA